MVSKHQVLHIPADAAIDGHEFASRKEAKTGIISILCDYVYMPFLFKNIKQFLQHCNFFNRAALYM